MNISLAQKHVEIEKCFPVLRQLRSTLLQKDFLDQVKRQQQKGYKLAFLEDLDKVMSVAGFRITENIGSQKTLYVHEFITDEAHRLKGYGSKLFEWLVEYATKKDCKSLQLDSQIERFSAHKFYLRNNMTICSYRFILSLE